MYKSYYSDADLYNLNILSVLLLEFMVISSNPLFCGPSQDIAFDKARNAVFCVRQSNEGRGASCLLHAVEHGNRLWKGREHGNVIVPISEAADFTGLQAQPTGQHLQRRAL